MFKIKWQVLFLLIVSVCLATNSSANQNVKVDGRTIVEDFDGDGIYVPYIIKGVGYSPFSIGRHPSDWGWTDPGDPREDNILDDSDILNRDFSLLEAMNVNTIRLWKGDDTEDLEGRYPVKLTNTTLNTARQYNIKVIAGFWIDPAGEYICTDTGSEYVQNIDFTDQVVRDDILGRFVSYVSDFKNHDAILFWAIGNENNLHLENDPAKIEAFYSLIDEMAQMAHQVEGANAHPVAFVNGDLQFIGDELYGTSDELLANLDIWGANVYRGRSFGTFFDDYAERSQKPLWISEYGVDAWNTLDIENPDSGYEDEATHALWVGDQWNEIISNTEITIGATLMSYADEWWKPSEWLCGDDSDLCNAEQNHFGFGPQDLTCPADGIIDWYPPMPDNFINAEWWGVMKIALDPVDPYGPDVMTPRAVYSALQNLFLNEAPEFTNAPFPTAVVDQLYQYDMEAVDADGDALTFSLVQGPTDMLINTVTGLVTWMPGADDVGTYNVTLKVQDPQGAFDLYNYTLEVVGLGITFYSDSGILVGTDIYVWSDLSATFDGQYVDDSAPEGEQTFLTSSASWAGWGVFYDNGLEDFSAYSSSYLKFWVKTPVDLKIGVRDVSSTQERMLSWYGWDTTDTWQEIVVYLPDFGMDLSAIESPFMITAETGTSFYVDYVRWVESLSTNQLPVITSFPELSAVAGEIYVYDVDATDSDGDVLVYSLVESPVGMTIDSSTGLIDWTPGADNIGDHMVTVKVEDGQGGNAFQGYTLSVVQPLNHNPVITSLPVTSVIAGELYAYDVQAVDEDNDPLTYSLTAAPAGMTINSSTGLIAWSTATEDTGSYAVEVLVEDDAGGSAAQNYTLEVLAPVVTEDLNVYADSGIPVNSDILVWSAETATFNGNYIDPDDVAPEGEEIFLTESADWAGWGVFYTDGFHDLSEYTEGYLKFWVKTPVDLKIGLKDSSGTFERMLSSYGWNGSATWQEITVFVGDFARDLTQMESPFLITAEVGTAFYVDYVRWTKAPVNIYPEIISTPVLTAEADTLYQYNVDATDADGDTLQYLLVESPVGMTIDVVTGLILWTPAVGDAGDHAITAKVEDGRGGFAVQSYTLTVTGAVINQDPVITEDVTADPETVDEKETSTITVIAMDPDGDPLSYAWSATGGSISGTGAEVTYTAPSVRRDTFYTITVVVTDGNGGSDSGAVEVLVKNVKSPGKR